MGTRISEGYREGRRGQQVSTVKANPHSRRHQIDFPALIAVSRDLMQREKKLVPHSMKLVIITGKKQEYQKIILLVNTELKVASVFPRRGINIVGNAFSSSLKLRVKT